MSTISRRAAGLLCLASVILIWVSSSELIQFIFDSVDFQRPLFLTFYSTTLFSVYLLGFLCCSSWRKPPEEEAPAPDTQGLLAAENGQTAESETQGRLRHSQSSISFHSIASIYTPVTRKLPAVEVAKLAAAFVPFWFAANWTFNASLCIKCGTGTSVASNTIVSSTSSLFTLLLSVAFLKETPTVLKFVCVAFTCGGVYLVTKQDEDMPPDDDAPSSNSMFIGDLLALAGAVLFGCYSVLLKKLIPDENLVNMPMFFGFLGLINGVACIPILILFHYTKLEPFDPAPPSVFAYLTVNALIGTVLSDLLWAKAVVLTSPLTVNVGMSLTIPLSFLADFVTPGATRPSVQLEYLLGALLVLLSFIGVNASDSAKHQEPDGAARLREANDLADVMDDLADLDE